MRRLRYGAVWQTLGWLGVAAVVVLSLRAQSPQLPSFLGWDKVQHALGYATLMWWFGQVLAARTRTALAVLALGVALELLQTLTPARRFDYADMVANALGVAIGFALISTPLGRALAWADRFALRAIDRGRRRRGG